MSQISWLLEAARKIEVKENHLDNLCDLINNNKNSNSKDIITLRDNLCDLIKERQSRSNNGRFLSKKYNKSLSKYTGIYLNEGKWVAYIDKEKYRFATKELAEKYFEDEYKRLKMDVKTRLRDGYRIK